MFLRRRIEPVRIGIEQHRHLVDECARTTGTGPVHPLFDGLSVEGDLRILASELDRSIRFGDQFLDRPAAGYDLLLERDLHQLRQRQSAGARDDRLDGSVAEFMFRLLDQFFDLIEDIGHVPFIPAVDDVILIIHEYKFDCS